MKNLILGIFHRKPGQDLQRVRDEFSLHGKRAVTSVRSGDVELHCGQGLGKMLFYEDERVIVAFSGEPFFEGDFEMFAAGLSLENVNEQIQAVQGMFTCCLFDKHRQEASVLNDYFGLFPLFVLQDEAAVIFCNEYQPLAVYRAQTKKLNQVAIAQYFQYGFVFDGLTFFQDIMLQKPRTAMTISAIGSKQAEYAVFSPVPFTSYAESLEQLFAALQKAVERQLKGHGKDDMRITLSGGLDTRMILGLIPEKQRADYKFRTFYLQPLNEATDKDVLAARKMAEALHLDWEVVDFVDLTETLTVDYFKKQRLPLRYKKLMGLFGGEILSGVLYDHMYAPDTLSDIREANDMSNASFLRRLFSGSVKRNALGQELFSYADSPDRQNNFSFHVLSRSFFTSIYNGTEGMWINPWSHLTRYSTPFMDTDFLKVLFRIPVAYIYECDHAFYYDIYRKYLPEYQGFPTNSTLPNVEENGFQFIAEGQEAKKTKVNRSGHLFDELLSEQSQDPEVLQHLDANRDRLQFRQRVIDFGLWKRYINSL